MEVEEKLEFNVLKECLSDNEIEKISSEVCTKLEYFFQEKFDAFITAKAVFETHRKNIGKLNYSQFLSSYLRKI